jgi:hypothetical protein
MPAVAKNPASTITLLSKKMNARVNLATAQWVRKDPVARFLGSENAAQA